MRIFKTPKDCLSFVIIAVLFYLFLPVLEGLSLYRDLENGRFNINNDTIAVGLTQSVFPLIIIAPIFIGLIIWIASKYPFQIPFWSNNEDRPYQTFFWTVIFGFLIFEQLAACYSSLSEGNIFAIIESLLIVYFSLLFRVAIIFRGEIHREI